VIGLLRFIGLLNAAVWFGAAVFFLIVTDPAASSGEMQDLLGAPNYPFYSVAIGQLLAARYFHLFLACSVVALLHLVAEWLYFGRHPQRIWLGLVLGLCLVGVAQVAVIQPRLKGLHRLQYTRPDLREAAVQSFRFWHGVSETVQVLLLGGLAVYLWRVGNPSNPTRFLNAAKFHS
jgi:hypothetical protein